MDASSAVTVDMMQKMVEFVKASLKQYNFSNEHTNAYLMIFGREHKLLIKIGNKEDLNVLRRTLKNLMPMGGLKNIGGVLSAYNAMDLRQDAKKVVVLLTSGRDFSSEDVSVIGSALKKEVKVFAISVGLIHDVTTLKKFAKTDHIHQISHINDLPDVYGLLEEAIGISQGMHSLRLV